MRFKVTVLVEAFDDHDGFLASTKQEEMSRGAERGDVFDFASATALLSGPLEVAATGAFIDIGDQLKEPGRG